MKNKTEMNAEHLMVKANIRIKIEELSQYVEESIPSKGITSDTCQQRAILNRLMEVHQAISGLCDADFEQNQIDEEGVDYDDCSHGK